MDLIWRKAQRSTSNGGNCVELAALPGKVAARDSKNPSGSILTFTIAEMKDFMSQVQQGEYHL